MAYVCVIECNHCDKILTTGRDKILFVTDDGGEKHLCRPPSERDKICQILNISFEEYNRAYQTDCPDCRSITKPKWWWSKSQKDQLLVTLRNQEEKRQKVLALIEERTGFSLSCICVACLEECEIDLKRESIVTSDDRRCPQCGSMTVYTFSELIGSKCPFCKTGSIVEKITDTRV